MYSYHFTHQASHLGKEDRDYEEVGLRQALKGKKEEDRVRLLAEASAAYQDT